MAELSEAEFEETNEAGRVSLRSEPHASTARYSCQTDRIVIELTNGCSFVFPPKLAQGLEQGSPEQLAEIHVSPAGASLHWPSLDVDFSVAGLVTGLFATRAYLARRSGQAVTPAKSAAARENGTKGGRPRGLQRYRLKIVR